VLSLILTIIEGARINSSKVIAERSLSTAMDSVLADYYQPLWEEYHLFGLHMEGNSVIRDGIIVEELEKYMSYTFEPNRGMSLGVKGIDLYNINLSSLSTDNQTMFSDYGGELMLHQAVAYMKYKEIGEGVEKILGQMSLLETPNKVSYIYEEKQKVEEELIEIDHCILELMRLFDGIETGKHGIVTRNNGALKVSDYYIKQFCSEEITKENVGINQEDIYQALKSTYINPINDLNTINNKLKTLEELQNQLLNLQSQISSNNEMLTKEYTSLALLQNLESTKEVKAQIKTVKAFISDLEDEKQVLNNEISDRNYAYQVGKESIIQINRWLELRMDKIRPLIGEAITAINRIIYKAESAGPIIDYYEKLLKNEEQNIDSTIYASLTKELKGLKNYISSSKEGYDFVRMKRILEHNLMVLENTRKEISQAETKLLSSNIYGAKSSYNSAAIQIQTYQIKGLHLDYSKIVLNKSTEIDIIEPIKDLINLGVSGLILDSKEISDKQISEAQLPSENAAFTEKEKDLLSEFSTIFNDTGFGNINQVLITLFRGLGEDTQALSELGEGINAIASELLFQEYLKDHFEKLPIKGENLNSRKPSVLLYEQEYLISGKRTDKDNISTIISRIILLRTIFDFASILGDEAKRNEAYVAASALVGFTGLPILVGTTQTMILLLWSFAEALVDACAIIIGKTVPILKKQLSLEFTDLFLLNRQFIHNKASKVIQTKELSVSYQDYLSIFLLMERNEKVIFRSMDLIQENIEMRYEDNFELKDVLFGFDVISEFTIPLKFTAVSFLRNMLSKDNSSVKYKVGFSMSY
jgi:hypothetical protein